jgi:hypothetical protein
MRVMRSKLGRDGVFIASYRAGAASRSSSEMCASSFMTALRRATIAGSFWRTLIRRARFADLVENSLAAGAARNCLDGWGRISTASLGECTTPWRVALGACTALNVRYTMSRSGNESVLRTMLLAEACDALKRRLGECSAILPAAVNQGASRGAQAIRDRCRPIARYAVSASGSASRAGATRSISPRTPTEPR